MVQVSVELDTSRLSSMPDKIPQVKEKGLSYAGQAMVSALMFNSPVDHGLLKSWFIESSSEDEVHIKSPAEYALYQDQGTRDHMIRPKTKEALFWGEFNGKKPIMSKGHMVKGITGKHFVEKSFNEVQPQLEGFFIRALHEVLE